ncbi:MAG: riboflavin synthase [Desulfurococcales archaeon]|nr:riboflavin synthase [Desulfurococcales archaeon]MEB3758327.1 riboflavin synthase [Desulfurococcales archaeon]MEB3772931.1 riboflavin synthase [Desulfurococcales archaeon]MEB3786740.1 riboflavin synthase [Desulfurococcales archaeon]MEB3799146.1 riboflavin synthase [Desulfurococcales archaeon]
MAGCVAVIDTMFSRVDMGSIAYKVLREELTSYKIERWTVPGAKDLPGAARRAIDRGCDAVITLGWIGKREADRITYAVSSMGLVLLGVLTGKIIIDVTVHEDEADDPSDLKRIAEERARDHAVNLALLLKDPHALVRNAGKGIRQGYPNAGPL